MTNRFSGGAAVLWGVLLALVGLAVFIGGIGLALGYEAVIRAFVMQPGAWLIAGGVALFFASAAALWQQVFSQESLLLERIMAVPHYLFALAGVVLCLGLAGIGVWGLDDPEGLVALGATFQASLIRWIEGL